MTLPKQVAEAVPSVHVLFERVARAKPDAIAVVCGEKHLSYGELERRANRLAVRLRKQQACPESRVALCMGRVAEMVVAMLATLKAGAAYVPLDPAYPREHLEFIVRDSAAQVIVAEPGVQKLSGVSIPVLMVEEPEGVEQAKGDESVPAAASVDAGNLAWIIYTSGSTGRPKGVGIEHRSAVALVQWSEQVFSADEMRGVLASTSWCFDLSAFEIWVPLLRGGVVIIVDNVLALENLPGRERVTLINSVPVAVRELADLGGIPKSVQTVNLAGEPLTRDLVDKLYAFAHIRRVLNLYGPTEDTTYSTWAEMKREKREKPLIGVSIAGSFNRVLGENLELTPPGEIGELYLGGAGLARGYIGQPEMTARKFVPDPLAEREGERLYRTGDMVRSLPEDSLEFIGRADHQVKLRGFRIELGEIEMLLKTHPCVRDALVMAREKNGDKHLVGYVIASRSGESGAGTPDGQKVDDKLGQDLRDYVRGRLPHFMVPSAIVVLSNWPLTLNGKIDRKRLPDPEFSRSVSESAAPRTPVEEAIADIWKEALGLERIGVEAGFFGLGGHSLTATRIISRVREVFGFQLPVQTVLENPTIAQLSDVVETKLRGVRETSATGMLAASRELPLRPVVRGELAPLSYAQRRIWISVQMHPQSAAFNVFIPLLLSGPLSFVACAQALGEIVRRHATLRSCLGVSDDQPMQRIRSHVPVKVPVVDLSGLEKGKRREVAMRLAPREGARLFDLERNLMIRIVQLRLSSEKQILLITIHHIATDVVSAAVFGKEFSLLYQAMSAGTPSPLPDLKIHYGDFAYWQREWLAGTALDYQRDYWRKQLEGAPRATALRTDHPRKSTPSLRGRYHAFSLAGELMEGFVQLAARESATLFMTVLAALKALLYRISGEADWIVGTDIANRTQAHTESLIGFFVNVLALRTRMMPGMTFRGLLREVRRTALDGYAHQDLPFEEVLKLTGRDGIKSPLFHVFCVLEHEADVNINIPGTEVSTLGLDQETALRELSLFARVAGGSLHLVWNYQMDLFEPATIWQWTKNLLALIRNVILQPDAPLADIGLTVQAPPSKQEKSGREISQERFRAVKPKAVDVVPHG